MRLIDSARDEAKARSLSFSSVPLQISTFRLVLQTAAEKEKGSGLLFRSSEDWSTSLGDGAFTELLRILRKDHGNVKGEALLESLFQKSSYLREQLYNERARNRRLQVSYFLISTCPVFSNLSITQAEIEDSTDTVRDLEQKKLALSNELEGLQKELEEAHLQNTTLQTQQEENCATVLELKNELKLATTDHEDALQQERVRGHRSICKVC